MKSLSVELKKSRRRHNTLVAVCISLFVLMWATQTGGSGAERLKQGYSSLFYAIPVMNTVVMPLGTAVLASRLWDLESKERSCRMLLTLQSRGSLFLGRAELALMQILLIGMIENLGILVFTNKIKISQNGRFQNRFQTQRSGFGSERWIDGTSVRRPFL